jgi:hypothetical protein
MPNHNLLFAPDLSNTDIETQSGYLDALQIAHGRELQESGIADMAREFTGRHETDVVFARIYARQNEEELGVKLIPNALDFENPDSRPIYLPLVRLRGIVRLHKIELLADITIDQLNLLLSQRTELEEAKEDAMLSKLNGHLDELAVNSKDEYTATMRPQSQDT